MLLLRGRTGPSQALSSQVRGTFQPTNTLDQQLTRESPGLEARDPSYALRPDSIAYVLRKFYQLDSKLYINLDKDMEIDYGVSVNKRGEGIFTVEGVIRIEVFHYQLAPMEG